MNDATSPDTLYSLMGGDTVLRAVVDRFYDLMDQDPSYSQLRAMHAPDLTLMRAKLGDWLSGWLGGPALYDERPDATCIGHAHAPFRIDQQMQNDWLSCMVRALDDCSVPVPVQARLRPPLAALAGFLRNH